MKLLIKFPTVMIYNNIECELFKEECTEVCHVPTAVCERGCGEGGRCIGPNVCQCRQGTIASSCHE